TIDNDISMVQMSFGFDTAVSEARRAIYGAYTEAAGGRNGIGLVKLMGRESGFIAALSALANDVVDFCLVPEIPFTVEALLSALEDHLREKGHAVIVAAEGAGQDLPDGSEERDSSGNVRLKDIGLYIKEKVLACFSEKGIEVNLKYIDPGYIIRSVPANARDSAFCLLLGQNAVHAGMAGRTNMVVGFWRNEFTHVPISAAIARRKKIDPESWLWSAVLAATRQPELR
ncbi:MAG: 6-phosphofructokinase, partial [Zetaproteobacteria bacterium]|nr:6-phosphofructokinase [Zetaproteobacteria bacterium]